MSKDGVMVAPEKIEAVGEWQVPKNKSELSTFLGFPSYHRDYKANFVGSSEILSRMTGCRVNFAWTEEHKLLKL